MRQLLLIILASVVSFASLKCLPAPYVWISLWWFLVFLYAALSSKRSSIKAVWFNIGTIILAFGLFEAYLWVTGPAEFWTEQTSLKDSRWREHDFLGGIPVKDDKVCIKKFCGKDLIYDVTYTIDPQGLRVSSPDRGGDDVRSILFFGGSFMFGWGLNDAEALPYQIGVQTKGNYHIYNFGVPGYGPNHMLSALEHGYVKNIVECKPSYAIYEAIYDHVRRAAHNDPGSRRPKYTLDANGNIVYQGRFDEFAIVPVETIRELKKSRVLRRIINKHKPINSHDIDIFIKTVAKSRDLLEDFYPGIKFHLLFWWEPRDQSPKMKKILSGLKGNGITVHLIRDILPVDIDKNWINYKISPLDGHPNARANELIAKYILKKIIRK